MAEFTLEQKQAMAMASAKRKRAEAEQSGQPSPPASAEPKPVEYEFSKSVENFPSSALQVGKDFLNMVAHPIDTAKGFQTLGQGLIEKAYVPESINGVDFGQTQGEQTVDAFGGMVKDRYGSLDAIKQTLMDDPAGAALDASMFFTGGATAGAKAANVAAKAIPKRLPHKMLSDALKFRPKLDPKMKDSIVATLLRENIKPKNSGLSKAHQLKDMLNSKIDDLIENTKPGATFDRDIVFKYIDDVKADLTGKVIDGGGDLKIIDNIVDEFKAHMDTLKTGDKFTAAELQHFKKNAYKKINWEKTDQPLAKNDTYLAQAKAAREGLETLSPEIKALNAREGAIIEALKELPAVSNKMANYRTMGMDTALKTITGSMIHPVVGAAGATWGIAGHPRVKSAIAYALQSAKNSAPRTGALADKMANITMGQALLNSPRYKEQ